MQRELSELIRRTVKLDIISFEEHQRYTISCFHTQLLYNGESLETFQNNVDVLRAMLILKHALWHMTTQTIHTISVGKLDLCPRQWKMRLRKFIFNRTIPINEFLTDKDQANVSVLIEEEKTSKCYWEISDAGWIHSKSNFTDLYNRNQ